MERATSATRRGPFRLAGEAFSLPLQGAAATFSCFVILLVFFGGGFAYAWQRWGTLVQNHPRYAIDAERLELPPQPEWIPASVKDEVFRDGNLATLSLLDPQVTLKVAREFALHCWVSHVRRVRKDYSGRVIVELDYRRPVAMVEVTTNGQRGLLPVDAAGVLLPPQDFTPEQTRDFLRIAVGDTLPVGSPGTPWGDPAIAEAAVIAETLRDAWRGARLYRVFLPPPPQGTRGRLPDRQYRLLTRDGAELIWGHAVGAESGTEAKAADKVFRLARLAEQPGALSPSASESPWDLREALPAGPVKKPTPSDGLPTGYGTGALSPTTRE
jgi:hypothetical protein